MHFLRFSLLFLSTLSSAAALPSSIATTPSTSPPAPETPTQAPGVILKDVVIKCSDTEHWGNWYACMKNNASAQCDPMPDEPTRHMCRQLWEITCDVKLTSLPARSSLAKGDAALWEAGGTQKYKESLELSWMFLVIYGGSALVMAILVTVEEVIWCWFSYSLLGG
ncbi:hypothetical protein F5B19DRAFT_492354 [Rostrohypoxylon terebratum]|nr:hypothetical protein F5B19DRAFT_492354 [Rostrohypoxylon terebratum]